MVRPRVARPGARIDSRPRGAPATAWPYPRATLSPRPPEPFRCDVERAGDDVVLIPRGEIDLASVPMLEATRREVRNGGFERVILDLSNVTFMDSTGLRLVLTWADAHERDGMQLRLVPGPPQVQRLFEVTGMLPRLPWVGGDPPLER